MSVTNEHHQQRFTDDTSNLSAPIITATELRAEESKNLFGQMYEK
jgi:hypothetical protein